MKLSELIRGRPRRQATGDVEVSTAPAREQSLQAPNDSVCGLSDVGQGRDTNEDAFYLSEARPFFIVADGMGGHQAGDVASTTAVGEVRNYFERDMSQDLAVDSVTLGTLMIGSLMKAHQKIARLASERPGCEGMGTTLLLAFVLGNELHTCHVGDVRCYVRSVSGLHQVTQDHSVVGSLVRDGLITPEQARVHPRKNEILQALGTARPIAPEVNTRDLQEGDRVLLCTDGLWGSLGDADIASVLNWDGTMRQIATQLVDRANSASCSDNLTAVLYEHGHRVLTRY